MNLQPHMPNLDVRAALLGAAITALALNAVDGLRRGKALMFYAQVDRSDDPILFWATVGLSAALAVGAAVALIFG